MFMLIGNVRGFHWGVLGLVWGLMSSSYAELAEESLASLFLEKGFQKCQEAENMMDVSHLRAERKLNQFELYLKEVKTSFNGQWSRLELKDRQRVNQCLALKPELKVKKAQKLMDKALSECDKAFEFMAQNQLHFASNRNSVYELYRFEAVTKAPQIVIRNQRALRRCEQFSHLLEQKIKPLEQEEKGELSKPEYSMLKNQNPTAFFPGDSQPKSSARF